MYIVVCSNDITGLGKFFFTSQVSVLSAEWGWATGKRALRGVLSGWGGLMEGSSAKSGLG
jgi:hypothetical protein